MEKTLYLSPENMNACSTENCIVRLRFEVARNVYGQCHHYTLEHVNFLCNRVKDTVPDS